MDSGKVRLKEVLNTEFQKHSYCGSQHYLSQFFFFFNIHGLENIFVLAKRNKFFLKVLNELNMFALDFVVS